MRLLHFFACFLLMTPSFAQSTDSPVGKWKTIDDATGETKSIIEIVEADGVFSGFVAEILTDRKDAICTKCTGDLKDRPVLGMTIITGLKAKGDFWKYGSILDPESGKTYKLSIWYENDDPNKLYIRGKHWTGLYRTQTWIRADI